jgi:3-mercaptopropionate dioxygenase
MALAESSRLNELIRRLDDAVKIQEQHGCCQAVKEVLEQIVRSGEEFVDPSLLQPAPNGYARRLIHKDPDERYSLMAMVWGTGQGTALHDHAGMWCVECVYRGKIRVESYELMGSDEVDLVQFEKRESIFAGVGEAGALIPPYDYHTIDNPHEQTAITLHVYAGEMNWCHAFLPVEGGYKRERRELSYTA